ncbi:hypothetical protein LZ30DRAFT_785435 [Colletotrichum cereale]|nr:hypothetical protein LZ30DRAFT_785435 [Colletotrichum cereale]
MASHAVTPETIAVAATTITAIAPAPMSSQQLRHYIQATIASDMTQHIRRKLSSCPDYRDMLATAINKRIRRRLKPSSVPDEREKELTRRAEDERRRKNLIAALTHHLPSDLSPVIG